VTKADAPARKIDVRALTRTELAARIDEIAALRIAVFRDWPYLYDGDPDYERRYLRHYLDSAHAVVAGAFIGQTLVGAATGTPMTDHSNDFAAALSDTGLDLSRVFYCAESVLLPDFRGLGVGHRFFDIREGKAREMGCEHIAFCGVIRPDNHPMRPKVARALAPFWQGRGYAPLPGAIAHFAWRDIGDTQESRKPLQVWVKALR
jgi:GNAT superfamily N-acetyltransferase